MSNDSGIESDTYSSRVALAVDYLRGNVKWTLVAFGAIGTTLLAGSQLSNLGKFETTDFRLWMALTCAFVALGTASYAVYLALKVAYTGYTEFYHLNKSDIAHAEENPALLEGFGSVAALKAAYEKAVADRHSALVAEVKDIEAIESNQTWFEYLDNLVDDVVSYVRYNRIREQAEKTRIRLTVVSIAAGFALVGFAWAANPKIESSSIILQSPPSEATLSLTATGKSVLTPLLGAHCTALDHIPVVVISVAASGSDLVSMKSKDCALARFTINDALGKLLPL
jgi:uncharacterized membrane protein